MGHVTGYNEQCTPSRRLAQAFEHMTPYLANREPAMRWLFHGSAMEYQKTGKTILKSYEDDIMIRPIFLD